MKTLRFALLLAAWGLAAVPAGWADDAKAKAPFDVQVVEDVVYYDGKDADEKKHKLDLYLPKGQKDVPVLFWVHGGGWRNGDRKGTQALGQFFASKGLCFATISYRLTPQVKHPGHVQDVARAFAWTVQNVGKHGGRADAIFVSGHSAGGHLVALLATDDSYLKAHKLSFSNIRGVIPVSGPQRLTFRENLKDAFGDDEEAFKKASPLSYIGDKHPPFLILYAEKDNEGIRRTSAELGEVLKKAKIEAAIVDVKDRDHGSIIREIPKEGDPTAKAMLDFIAKHSAAKGK